MIKILIVDDSVQKTEKIKNVINALLLADDVVVRTAPHAYQAVQELSTGTFDLMILDLNIPMRNDGSPRPDGGLKLLYNMPRNKMIGMPAHIVGLTAFDELYEKHKGSFEKEGWLLLPFQEDSTSWETSLESKLTHISQAKRPAQSKTPTKPSPWRTGSFYVFAIVAVAITLAVVAHYVSLYAVPIVMAGVLLAVPAISFLQLKHDGQLGERSFVELYKAYFHKLSLLERLRPLLERPHRPKPPGEGSPKGE